MKTVSRCGIAILVVAGVFSLSTVALAQDDSELPSVEDVEDHLDDLYRSDSSRAEMTMSIETDRRSRQLEMEAWTQGEDNAVFVIRAPAREAGTATLRTEDGLWNYAPRADRLVRIPTGMLSDDWMGSHLTNDDLVRETGYGDDYDVELSWDERDGERVLLATMTPDEGAPVVYTRIEYVLDADDWTPRQAVFFEDDDEIRTMTFSDVREVNDRQVPHTMEVRPADEPGEYTRLEYQQLEFDVDIDESIFSRRGLRRLAR